jgi:hypothetical protein
MTKVCVTFEGDDWYAVTAQMREAMGMDRAVGLDDCDTVPAAIPLAEPEPEPEPEPKKAAARSHKSKPVLVPATPAEPEASSTPAPKRELPPLDLLKQAITVAVRAAQKSEGPKTILELLPEFKRETGLDFVMNAQEEHREALRDLVEAAGLQPA